MALRDLQVLLTFRLTLVAFLPLAFSAWGCASGRVVGPTDSETLEAAQPAPEKPSCGGSLDLTLDNYGLSFGNSCVTHGVRFNLRDEAAKEVNGLNFTLWVPAHDPVEEVSGLAIGLVPAASKMNGLSLGLAGVVTKKQLSGIGLSGGLLLGKRLSGIQLSGLLLSARGWTDGTTEIPGYVEGISLSGLLSLTSDGMDGIHAAGLVNVSEGPLRGIFLNGLGTVTREEITGVQATLGVSFAGEDITGLSLTGLLSASQGSMSMINASGLVTVADKDIEGLVVSGLVTLAQGNLLGTSIGGLGVVAGRQGSGIHIGGLFLGAGPQDYPFLRLPATEGGPEAGRGGLSGLQLAGLWIQAPQVYGLSAAGILINTKTATGACIAAVNAIGERETGLSVGLFNYANNLDGLQIGLLNYVAENPVPFKLLPLLNLNFN